MTYAPRSTHNDYSVFLDEQLGDVRVQAERNHLTGDIVYVLTTDRKATSGTARSIDEVYAAAKVMNNV